ncbi:hypothetical protein [Burkholderia multivorans]|uniref:hypothetical protein n=1 Tax=Burkholderia multivorans TaxID=87883 RepID=UPI001C269F33|nr:hypothetical protein [Burkholderia multivorans]MBU9576483.1 hypothetical protein [Burkholderia multivorans]
MTEHYARVLCLMREKYDYPRAYMKKTSAPTPYMLVPGLWAEAVLPKNGEVTDRILDRYHTMLLNSADPVNNLLGTLSVIFWGFATMGGRAPDRANKHLTGYKSKPGTTHYAAGQAMAAVRAETNLGTALGHLAPLAVLGQMPFASKIIAHSRPNVAGIMDNQLASGLALDAWAQNVPFLRSIGAVDEPRYQRRYAAWCGFLCVLADQLNAGIANGIPWGWRENGRTHRWRAIDVERALFQYYRWKKKSSLTLSALLELQQPEPEVV